MRNGDAANGNAIFQYSCHLGAAQQWEFTTAPDGSEALRSAASGKIVEPDNNGTGNASPIQQWTDLTALNQRWTSVAV